MQTWSDFGPRFPAAAERESPAGAEHPGSVEADRHGAGGPVAESEQASDLVGASGSEVSVSRFARVGSQPRPDPESCDGENASDEPAADIGRRFVIFGDASALGGRPGGRTLCDPKRALTFLERDAPLQDEVTQPHVELDLRIPQIILHRDDGCVPMGLKVSQDSPGCRSNLALPHLLHS